MSLIARSAKLQLVYGLKMIKTATLNTNHSNIVLVHVLRIWMVATAPLPLNEVLKKYMYLVGSHVQLQVATRYSQCRHNSHGVWF